MQLQLMNASTMKVVAGEPFTDEDTAARECDRLTNETDPTAVILTASQSVLTFRFVTLARLIIILSSRPRPCVRVTVCAWCLCHGRRNQSCR